MDRRVALKVLPAGVAADERALQRFVREAKTAGQLSHPNVVGVHAMGVYENTPYYSMEFVEGETLAQVIQKVKEADDDAETPFGPKNSQDYFIRIGAAFAEVADGLQHAHSKGVIHRDIKPSNLILDREARLRILDFGLARLEGQESITISGDIVGTPLYMSPEQARQKKIKVDYRTDVYSLGATMYELLAWRPPFKGRNHRDTLSQIIERDPVEPRRVNPRVPRDLETIVLKCLRKDPGDRYGTAEALAQDLGRFVRGDPIEGQPQSGLDRLVRKARANGRKIAGLVALVVLLAFLGMMGHEIFRAKERLRSLLPREAAEVLGGFFDDNLEVIDVGVEGKVYGPVISPDELTLYFTRWEGPARNNPDIYFMTRKWRGEPFKVPARPVPDINTPHQEWVCGSCLSLDGQEIYFTSDGRGSTDKDVWVARFNVPGNPEKGFHDIEKLGPSVNASGRQGGPIISQDGLRLYFDSFDQVHVATRKKKGDLFENPVPLGIRFGGGWLSEVSPGELILFWTANLPQGYGGNDIWISTRESITNALKLPVSFDGVVNLGTPINTDSGDSAPCLTADWPRPGSALYFTRDLKTILRATWHPREGRK